MSRSFTSGVDPYEFQFIIQNSISAYSDAAYTNARKLSGTAIVGADATINTSTEDYFGQMRWYKTLSPVINVASVTDPTAGTTTEVTSAHANYIKTVRTHGARNVNIQSVISKQDGLAKIGRDFGETKALDEHNSILEALKGVAAYEVSRGTGIESFTGTAEFGEAKGFFVDLGVGAGSSKLILDKATASAMGASQGAPLFRSVGMAWKDYEDSYFYMITSPETLADLRDANLVDSIIVTEGNLQFNTIYNGKFRLILTRADQGNFSASANVDDAATKTTFIVKPNSMTMKALEVPMPVEMDRDPKAYMGGGTTDIWYRWGYVVHPYGYDWAGSTTQFVKKAGAGGYDQAASWTRADQSYLNLGILPIFHS